MTTDTTPQEGEAETPPTEEGMTIDAAKAEIDKLRKEAARYRTKAKELEPLAAKAAAADEANKTELQKLTERLDAAEQQAKTATTEAMRLRIASAHNISAEDAALFLTGQDEETMTEQATRFAAAVNARKKSGLVVPGEGVQPPTASDPRREFLRSLSG